MIQATQRRHFAALRQLMAEINAADPTLQLDTLSMGMSDDLEAAIAEGATVVRVGSAIFGQRSYHQLWQLISHGVTLMKITFLGGGNMAIALVGGLIQRGFAPHDLSVIEILPEARERLSAQFAINVFAEASAEALACDVLVLAVKPQQMRAALSSLPTGDNKTADCQHCRWAVWSTTWPAGWAVTVVSSAPCPIRRR